MTDFARLAPGAPVPPLRVGTVGGPCWRLCDQKPKNFTLVLFYRGYHCLFCRKQLQELEEKFEHFQKRGVSVLAVSADSRDRAERTAEEWAIDRLTLCWGLGMDQARAWGLYISKGRGKSIRGIEEPEFFVEPAMFLVRPDGTLFGGMVQTMPFARPRIDDLLFGIDFVVANGVMPRGDADGISASSASAPGPADAAACHLHEPVVCSAQDQSVA